MKNIEQEDQFLRDLFQESKAENALNVTEKVMQHIDSTSDVFVYKPIISKAGWIVILSSFFGLICLLMGQSSGVLIDSPELSLFFKTTLPSLFDTISLDFSAPKIPTMSVTLMMTLISIIIFGVFLMISYRWNRWMFRS